MYVLCSWSFLTNRNLGDGLRGITEQGLVKTKHVLSFKPCVYMSRSTVVLTFLSRDGSRLIFISIVCVCCVCVQDTKEFLDSQWNIIITLVAILSFHYILVFILLLVRKGDGVCDNAVRGLPSVSSWKGGEGRTVDDCNEFAEHNSLMVDDSRAVVSKGCP